ncbi:outer membrane protein assembly factor BamD [Chitiniphilus shinanonensis]|uniref:Outer membrane protein assembly factor BamD n=1 Tax=Chitiniphilus shinanonensis TaxID=553088 RepID=A0ABQ6BU61_9NEIS|nr:outer membrane protein assembly factor BamD [Chitiniphilus shinanonensis]GLS05233.1 outer membrane protein assembly factor BamD [Chitiniphilus shinanonensis]
MNKILPRILAASIAAALIAGCSSTPQEQDETRGWSAEKIYSEAKAEQSSKNYENSNKLLEKLEARYPYGRYAQQAILETAYNHYKDQEPLLALSAIDRFIKQYPAHPSMDYALYLRGLVFFNESQGFMSFLAKQDMSERDPKAARDSFDSFKQLVTRFPESRYAGDAQVRMGYLIGALSNYELHVARYYYKRGAYLAAANRGKYLLEVYGNTKQVEPAMGMMVLAYDKLGMNELRDDTKRVLLKNYPQTTVLDKNFLDDRAWWAPW